MGLKSRRILHVPLSSSGEPGATRFAGLSSEQSICGAVPTILADQKLDLSTTELAIFSSPLWLRAGRDSNQFQLIFYVSTELRYILNGMSG